MKIALFSESYKPYISGVSRSVELLKKGLEALGHEVFVFAPDYPIYKDDEKNIIRLPSVPSKYPGFRVALPRPNLMPKVHFDIVHSASPFLLGIWSMIYARRRGLPYVYTFHTLFTEYLHYVPLPRKISLKIISFLIKHFCNRCDAVIVPSEMAKEYLLGFGVTRAINVVPSGIDDELCLKASPAGIREKLKIPADAKVLVYVGRLSKEKNVPFLLRVFAAVLAARPGTYLLIVADGPVRRELESLSKDLGIDKKTVFAGQVPYPEVLNYYKAGDIFVFSSKTETQGLVAAEAKACGLPVVALNARGIKESVVDGQDGFLVEEDEKAFLEKVLLLLDSRDLREEMARKAAENSLRDFSLEIIAKKAEMVYNFLKR